MYLRDTVKKLTTSLGHQTESSLQSSRSSFRYIIRRMSPLLCCAALLEATGDEPTVKSCRADIEQLFYGFPILCCGPFAELMTQKRFADADFPFPFLSGCAYASNWGQMLVGVQRSCVMEKAIVMELETREIDMDMIVIK